MLEFLNSLLTIVATVAHDADIETFIGQAVDAFRTSCEEVGSTMVQEGPDSYFCK